MKLNHYLPVLPALLCACAHSDPFPTGPIDLLGPFGENNNQLTFNPGDDYAPSWTSDGNKILYTFSVVDSTTVPKGSRCIGMVPALGGTRTFTFCDTRSTQADSSSMFLAVALRPDGELLFLQATGKPKFSPAPRTVLLWLADTAAPLSVRHQLARFPMLIGDSVIEYLTDATWIDPNTFIALGSRMTYPCTAPRCTNRDTLPRPVYMVRGAVTEQNVTFSQIRGTELAARWARTPAGEILFVKGRIDDLGFLALDPTIMVVPAEGGTAEVFATVPNGAAIRGLTCQAGSCLVLNSQLYHLDPTSRAFTPVNLPNTTFSTWDSPVLSPDGTTLVYHAGRNLFRIGVPAP